MITALDSAVLDANSEELGVSVSKLMENAGRALAGKVDSMGPRRALFICGSGNNGGDGYTAARMCSSPHDVCAFRPPKSALCRAAAEGSETVVYDEVNLSDYDLLVDCVLGTGQSGTLRPEYVRYIERVNSSGCRVVACDMPTGLGTGTCVKADITVTFHDIKEGMDAPECGTVIIADIGIPADASGVVGRGDFLRYPRPDPGSHKGQNGRLLIVGGGPYIGAPAMAALGALRAGADLVTIMTPESSAVQIGSMSPAYMVRTLKGDWLKPEHLYTILSIADGSDAVLIGPGLGTAKDTAEAVRALVREVRKPMVIDADGINCLAGATPESLKDVVLTPHSREAIGLLGSEDPASFCREKGCVLLIKGPEDRIYSDVDMRVNRTGCVGMTVGGTGDVLAGICAGLLSKGMRPKDAAALGAYISGKAGEMAFDEKSYGMLPTDVIERIPDVLREYL